MSSQLACQWVLEDFFKKIRTQVNTLTIESPLATNGHIYNGLLDRKRWTKGGKYKDQITSALGPGIYFDFA